MAVETWRPGMRATALRLAAITPQWRDWTPTWTTSTGVNTPSFGNATVLARYAQAGDVVFYRLEITFGSTTSFGGGTGSDNWQWALPVNAAQTMQHAGTAAIQDNSAGAGSRTIARVRLASTSTMSLETAAGRSDATSISGVGLMDAVTPWTWANGDWIYAQGSYEAA